MSRRPNCSTEVELDVSTLATTTLATELLAAPKSAEAAEPAWSAALPLHFFELLSVFPLIAPLVVGVALLRVGENVVRGVDFFEPCLGIAVTTVDVRVVLPRELAVGGGDVPLRGSTGYTEDLIKVTRHRGFRS